MQRRRAAQPGGELIGLTTAQAALGGSETPGGFAVPLDGGMKRIIDVLIAARKWNTAFWALKFEPDVRRRLAASYDARAWRRDRRPRARGLLAATSSRPSTTPRFTTYDDLYLQIGIGLAGGTAKIEALGGDNRPRDLHRDIGQVVHAGQGDRLAPSAGRRRVSRVDYTSILAQRVSRQRRAVGRGHPRGRAGQPGRQGQAAGRINVITRVNGKPVATPAEFYEAMPRTGSVKLTIANPEDREDVVTLDLK